MPKNKLLDIILFVLAGLVILGSVAAGYYFYTENQAYIGRMEAQQKQIDDANREINTYKSDNFKLAQIEAEKKRLDTFTPTMQNQAEFVIELEKLAETSALKVISCKMEPKPQTIKSMSNFQAYRWIVIFQGNYKQLLDFLNKLPKSERMVAVAEMTISSELTATSRDNYIMQIEMGLDLISRSPSAPASPSSKPSPPTT